MLPKVSRRGMRSHTERKSRPYSTSAAMARIRRVRFIDLRAGQLYGKKPQALPKRVAAQERQKKGWRLALPLRPQLADDPSGRAYGRRQDSGQVFHLSHHAVGVVDQRLQSMSHASDAVFADQRAVVPERLGLRCREAQKCRLSVIAQVAKHGPAVVKFVGGGDKTC